MITPTEEKTAWKKTLLTAVGFLALILGLIGIIVPVLPTTPFLLFSAACFIRSSDRLYHWLIHHKVFGEYIRNYREHKAIPLKTKVFSVVMLWITILFSVIYVVDSMYIQIALIGIAIAVSAHILHFKTLHK